MKALALSQGDLVVGPGGYSTSHGAAKVRQDLALALGEYFGTDRFHADIWGSTAPDYLGQPITPDLIFEVRGEVARTVAQYIAIQDQEVYRDVIEGRRSRYSASDVVRSVTSIQVQVLPAAIFIALSLVTQDGAAVELNRSVTIA